MSCERRDLSLRPAEESPVLVEVNGTALTQREFNYFLPEDYQNVLTWVERREYLDRWITTQLLYDEVMKSKIHIPEDMEARLEQYKKDLIADQLVQRVVAEQATVAEAEIEAYYREHEAEYVTEYRVSHVLVNTLEEAENVRSQIGKRSFAYLAKRYSIDKYSRYGGDLGFLSKGNMIREFENVVFGMQANEVSDVIESEFGYHILMITEIRDARVKLEYEDVKEEIANQLALEKRKSTYDRLVKGLRSRAVIEIKDEALRLAGSEVDSLATFR